MDGGEKTKTFAKPTTTFATFGDSDDGPNGGPPPGRLRARKSAQRSQRKPRPSACVKPSKSAGPISPASSCIGAAGSGAPPLGRRRGAAGWYDDTRLERARFTQRTTAAAAKAGEAKLLLTRLDANEQIALVSALVLSAATGLLVYEPFSEQIRLEILEQIRLEVGSVGNAAAAGYPPSNVWKASQVFLCVVIGLNLYVLAIALSRGYGLRCCCRWRCCPCDRVLQRIQPVLTYARHTCCARAPKWLFRTHTHRLWCPLFRKVS